MEIIFPIGKLQFFQLGVRNLAREMSSTSTEVERSLESQQRRKRRSLPPPQPKRRQRRGCGGAELFFPQFLLAAYGNIHRPVGRSLLRRLLRSHLSLIRRSSSTSSRVGRHLPLSSIAPDALLALLPPLLTLRRCAALAILAADMVGAIALSSMEANEMLALDDGIMNAIVVVLESGIERKRVLAAVCNALLDMSTAPVGRRRLRDFPILVKLLSIFCQVACPTIQCLSVSSNKPDDNYKDVVVEDRFTALILSVALTLINLSGERIPSNVPENLATCFLAVLKEVWFRVRFGNPLARCLRKEGYASSMGSDVAEAVFRLSLNEPQYSSFATEMICKNIFGDADADLWYFFLNYWEQSPFLLKSSSRNFKENDVIFTALFDSLVGKRSAVLTSVLKGTISCPPIISDELDILSFLDEVKSRLGSPPLYGQDVRVVKTVRIISHNLKECQEKEVHFFNKEAFGKEFQVSDIQKCKEAFKDGYTIAMRGMAFRSKKISSVTDGLADIFGLPSVGANIYLTPPRSQGLSLHFDDHCVFVCQLLGRKKWNLSSCQKPTLPRLYENYGDSLLELSENGKNFDERHLTLQEGDVLYIPRGCPHEAHTIMNSDGSQEETEGLSLHLTLAIEVEPPFEWEGFIHISLHCWKEKQKRTCCPDGLKISYAALTNLMHIAIRVLASQESTFRRACMVAAHFPPSLMEQHILHQKAIFVHLISKIDEKCIFCDAFKHVEGAVNEPNHESVQWLRWLRHLPQEGTENEKTDFGNQLESFNDTIQLVSNDNDAKVAFEMVKTKFCSEVVFEDACKSFVILLNKYRGTRRQYINGMLSLHPNF